MTLPNRALDRPMPKPTAQVEAYVEAMGPDLAVTFLLVFGGAEMSVPDSPSGCSAHEAVIGTEAAARMSVLSHRLQKRVPLAKNWLAAMLHWQGHSIASIARTLRTTDVSVRKMLKDRTA